MSEDVLYRWYRAALDGDLDKAEALINLWEHAQEGDPSCVDLVAASPEIEVYAHVVQMALASYAEDIAFDPDLYLEKLQESGYRPTVAAKEYEAELEWVGEHYDEDGMPRNRIVTNWEDGRPPDHEKGEVAPSEVGTLTDAIVSLKQHVQEQAAENRMAEEAAKEVAPPQDDFKPQSIADAVQDLNYDVVRRAAERGIQPRPGDDDGY
jgi:hypothetical protein